MWAITNRTPYAAERTWVRDKKGMHHWIVVVKATFGVSNDGSLRLADEQKPPLLAPEYIGEPGKSSLRYEADLGPPKPTTDVLVVAHAYAPRGQSAPTVPVRLRVAFLQKEILVHGTRVFYEGITGIVPYRPLPFVKQPIQYELAWGGTDTSDPDPKKQGYDKRNPIGCGFALKRSRLLKQRAPSIEYPRGEQGSIGPAGFGPIPSYWSPRLEYAGTYDAQWEKMKKPLLPDDYDERFTLCAPRDQQPRQHLRGGELVELVHMTASGRLRFELPKIFLAFSTRFGRRVVEHRSRIASVIIEPDDSRLMVVWQTSLPVRSPDVDYLDETLIQEKPYLT
jgi:hypothetical protein